MTRRRFLLLIVGAIATVAGWLGWRRVKPPVVAVQLDTRPGDLSAAREATPWDVCIIGSGPAGTVLATELARRGQRTLLVESGIALDKLGSEPRLAGLEVYESTGAIDYPVRGSRVRALGGTSNIWTGRCSRLHEIDFQPNAYTPPGPGWPFRYPDFEPWYARADRTLRVRGGELSKFHAPRSTPLPLPQDMDISGLQSLFARAGVTVDFSPSSTAPGREGPVRAEPDLLPAYLKLAPGRLLSGVTVTRLEAGPDGRVTAAHVVNLDGTRAEVRARNYVVACGGLESARLLLLSRNDHHPAGLGNEHDRVGRSFMEHPNLNFSGFVEHSWSTLSPAYELGRSHQFYDSLKREGLGSALLVMVQSWVFREDLRNWSLEAIREKAGALFGRLRRAELHIGATLEMFPRDDNRIMLSERLRDPWGNPGAAVHLGFDDHDRRTRARVEAIIDGIYRKLGASEVTERGITWSHHHLGSCRMGSDPRSSVVDADLRVHSSPNLYVAGSACFVTGGAAHPTLAIVALSHRLADHLNR